MDELKDLITETLINFDNKSAVIGIVYWQFIVWSTNYIADIFNKRGGDNGEKQQKHKVPDNEKT